MKEFIAKRVQNMTPSITLAITAKANQLKSQGIDVISFGAGEPDFDTPEYIKKAGIEAIQKGFTRYTPATGITPLKEAISKKLLKDNGLEYSLDEIIVNSGAKNSISTALQAVCNPGDEVIIPVPYWVSYSEMVKIPEAVPVFVKTKAENNFKVTKEELLSVITPKTKVIMINTPSNPVGAVYSKKELQDIAEVVLENQIYVISDEIYEKMVYDDHKHISIASLNEKIKDLTILINGMSKAYAMTGWRLGYAAANKEVIQAMGKIQGHALSHPCSITQYAGLAALEGDQSIVQSMIKEFDKRRHYMIERLKSIDLLDYIYPEGAFYVFVNISKIFGRRFNDVNINSSLDFSNILLDEANVAVVPGIGFGIDNYIRLSYATSLKDIEEGLNRIEKFLKKIN
ncbi:pyridoxal phosphate-dependent aminotransferase [Garciella nitratireducens]|uniref:Aminotransferase n=1 Tax=Garciella nitratireducens DSM 15102 TaxID=1121911 RepID=A0A1T4JW46_9FIRM|nr:pyridoxal phosphate-dependent aminotransferase [Garciella nitratireducens]SJZ34297.1 aspartate aminotransferase [Garciella nitratireducens DSM 15102]